MTTTTTTPTSTTNSAATAAAVNSSSSQQIAGNFDEFLQILTTQLQNQDPLSPLDPNSFTQELVQFASVEQQINTNTNMQSLIGLQQATTDMSGLQLVGSTVTVAGNSAPLANASKSPASWSLTSPSAATAQITITNSSGQTVYTGTTPLNAGTQSYTWNGLGSNGAIWPDGNYTLAVNATGANGQAVAVSSQVQGLVTSVNANASPPTLTVGGNTVPISSVESINSGVSGLASSLTNNLSSLNSSISNLNSAIGTLSQYL
ncbi:MAG: flagellar hook capping FlgD N-terminal domain-containing protein [Xanthobacteraceae bacterium]